MNAPALLEAIAHVSATVNTRQRSASRSRAQRCDVAEITSAIQNVSSVLEANLRRKPQTSPAQHLGALTDSICSTSHAIAEHTSLLLSTEPTPSISGLIGRAYDENLHSDFLSSLLSTATVGRFASVFLDRILAHTFVEYLPGKETFQFCYREVRLDSLDDSLEGTEVGARRIDVLMRSSNRVVTIENKVFTNESHNQTHDYAAAVRKCYGEGGRPLQFILLSPTGMRAHDRQFASLSYRGMYEALLEGAQICPPHPTAAVVLEAYIACLAADFLLPEERAMRHSITDLQERGYELQ